MTLRKEQRRIENDFSQAVGLFRHDLVWSSEMEAIKLNLANYLEVKAALGAGNHPALISLVRTLIATENDFRVELR